MSEQPTTPTPEAPAPVEAPAPAPVTAPNSADAPAAPAPVEAPSTPVDTPASSAPVEQHDDEAGEVEHQAGDVVTFEVDNPYHDDGARVETHAALVVTARDGRVRLFDLGDVAALADLPAGAVQRA